MATVVVTVVKCVHLCVIKPLFRPSKHQFPVPVVVQVEQDDASLLNLLFYYHCTQHPKNFMELKQYDESSLKCYEYFVLLVY